MDFAFRLEDYLKPDSGVIVESLTTKNQFALSYLKIRKFLVIEALVSLIHVQFENGFRKIPLGMCYPWDKENRVFINDFVYKTVLPVDWKHDTHNEQTLHTAMRLNTAIHELYHLSGKHLNRITMKQYGYSPFSAELEEMAADLLAMRFVKRLYGFDIFKYLCENVSKVYSNRVVRRFKYAYCKLSKKEKAHFRKEMYEGFKLVESWIDTESLKQAVRETKPYTHITATNID